MSIYIFDKDGTICQSKSGKTFINFSFDQELISGVKKKIDSLKEQGHLVAVISNQGGVAFGYMTWTQAQSIVKHAASLIGAFHFEMCPFHPDGTIENLAIESNSRKPNPGMIIAVADLVFTDDWKTRQRCLHRADLSYQKEEIIYVGDRPEDKMALQNARKARPNIDFKFYWAKDFFNEEN